MSDEQKAEISVETIAKLTEVVSSLNDWAQEPYTITESRNTEWIKGYAQGMFLKVERKHDNKGTFSHFKGIKDDNGNMLSRGEHYLATEGSVDITLLPEYLATLVPGTHIITIVFDEYELTTEFTIYAEDYPVSGGTYDEFDITVVGEPLKPVPYRNGVDVSTHRKVLELGNGKYRMYVDPELRSQYCFMIEPASEYYVEYFNAKGEVVDRGLHGGTIRVTLIPKTGDNSNVFAYGLMALISLAGIGILLKKRR